MVFANRNFSINLLWISLVLFIVISIVFLLPVDPNDYWWFLRLGRDILGQGYIPTVDTYSYTQTGQPMFYPSWLAAITLFGLRQIGGLTFTVLARGVLIASFYLFIWLTCWEKGAGPRLASGLVLLTALAGSANWSIRPQTFAYPLFGLTLWLLVRWQLGKNRCLWLLPLVAALWVNLHGSFFLFFALCGSALVAGHGSRRLMLIILGVAFLATFINPSGPSVWWLSFQMTTNLSILQFSSEWSPPTNTNWQMNLFYICLLVFPLLIARSPRRLNGVEWLWFLGLGWLALSGLRYVIWFLAVMAPILATLITPLVRVHPERLEPRTHPGINLGFSMFFLLSTLTLLPAARIGWWKNGPPVLTANTPVEAVNWLKVHPDLPGPLWSDVVFASYLIEALPERLVWSDTRFHLFPVDQWRRYILICNADPGWVQALSQDGVNLLLLDPTSQPKLIQVLNLSESWKQVYQDNGALIFLRNNSI